MSLLTAALAVAVAYSFASLKVLRQYERGVSFFLGKFWGTKGPGLAFVPFGFATLKRVSLRTVAMDIAPQDVITRDNVTVKVNAVLYMRVGDPARAIIEIEDYLYATSQLAQTTLRSVLGEVELDELLADREKINARLEKIIDLRTDPWGIDVSAVEVKDVLLPDQLKRAMALQAEAERERRAKVIAAQGELQASETLAQAAHTLAGKRPAHDPPGRAAGTARRGARGRRDGRAGAVRDNGPPAHRGRRTTPDGPWLRSSPRASIVPRSTASCSAPPSSRPGSTTWAASSRRTRCSRSVGRSASPSGTCARRCSRCSRSPRPLPPPA
ncbi:MAG: slipin family protein [Vicinamibacterales bacterium]|nr:slipin family protein [Vicinamibacterales bacterium]